MGRFGRSFAQVAYRTTPVLGGVSVVRESIPMPVDAGKGRSGTRTRPSTWRATAKSSSAATRTGRPHLMEINARLSGSLEVAVRSGVPFPALLWQWAAGESLYSGGRAIRPVSRCGT